MRKIFVGISLLIFGSAPAFAQIPSWTGFYVGGHLGYGWGSEDWTRIAGTGGQQGNGRDRSSARLEYNYINFGMDRITSTR